MKANLKTILALTIKASLSKPVKKSELNKVKIKLITKEPHLFYIEEYTKTQSFHKTLNYDECLTYVKKILGKTFKAALFQTAEKDYQFLTNKRGFTRLLEQEPSKEKNETALEKTSHNKEKNYLLAEDRPIPFLIALGIMNKEGKVLAKKQKKFRQINRFLEFVDDILDELCKNTEPTEKNPLSIVDFGCGKSYLTFALYHFIVVEKKIPAKIIGLDLRSDVIQSCTELAKTCKYTDLLFFNDSIENFLSDKNNSQKNLDLVISLHACNTATDYALASAVQKNAKVILSVPCCQHELHTALQKRPLPSDNPYEPFGRYGIIREQFSALTTDLMRALLLEEAGYKVQVLEFIDIEHTAKNLLIRAVKRKTGSLKDKTKNSPTPSKSTESLKILQKELGIRLKLETLLADEKP